MNAALTQPQRFKRCPALRPRETAQSYLGRLTAFFGMRSPRQFCEAFGLDLRGIMHGRDEALQHLAELTGAPADELIRWTPKRIDERFMVLNGETLNTRDNPRSMLSMCPVCAREDIAARPGQNWDQAVHGRAEWMLQVVDCCAVHEVRLITHRGPKLDVARLDQGYEVTLLLEELHGLELERAEPDDFQLYVLSRIGIIPSRPSPLLDALPLVAVTQLCHAAGLDILTAEGKGTGLSDAERRKAGFSLLGHGPGVLKDKMISLRRGFAPRVCAGSLLRRLMEYLQKGRYMDPTFRKFLDEFVAVLFLTLPYAEGQTLLGRECPKRSLHDFRSAMAAYDVPAYQLRAFLEGSPNLVVQAFKRPQDALIDVEVADDLFLGRTPFLNVAAVGRKLGRTGMMAGHNLAFLKRAGLVREAYGAAMKPRSNLYSEPEIDALIQRLVGGKAEVEPDDPTMVSVYELSVGLGMSNQTFWDLVATGKLTGLRMAKGATFIDGLRVELSQVMRQICGIENAMTRPKVCTLLGVDRNIVYILEVNAALTSVPADPKFSHRLGDLFDATEVRAFRQAYMSLSEVRRLFPNQPSFHRLKNMGLSPAIHLKPVGKATGYATFYRRADVLNFP